MIFKKQYTNEEDKLTIIEENKDKTLIEEQNIMEGNFLIFSDTRPLEDIVNQLQQDSLTTFDVLATIYEELMMKGSV